jgi:hypothetical protein
LAQANTTRSRARSLLPRPAAGLFPWPGGLLVLAALVAYQNSFSVPFLFDDTAAIVDNPTIRHLWPIGEPLSPPGGLTVGGRPVLNLSFAVNQALGGLNVTGYHAVNLAIHILTGLTLFGLVRRTLELVGGRTCLQAILQSRRRQLVEYRFGIQTLLCFQPLRRPSSGSCIRCRPSR